MFAYRNRGAFGISRSNKIRSSSFTRTPKITYLTINIIRDTNKGTNSSTYRYFIRPGILIVGLGGSAYLIDRYAYSSIMTRSIRALYVMLWIAYEYSRNIAKYETISDLHNVAAERLLNMLRTNRGLYIKLGQAIANQGDFFPKEYQKKFVKLYDDAPVDTWEQIDKVLRKNLGENYEMEVFDSIDHDPVASASIAQVHKGKLKSNGESVAIKVQHHYINEQIVIDLFMYKLISKIYERVIDIPLRFFTKYVSEQMIEEADFVNEMENASKLRQIIKKDESMNNTNIYIPHSYSDLSKRQVLITEWCDGVALTDKDKLIASDIDLTLAMKQYIKVFGKQIFEYGFIHSDPHPGNLLARFDNAGNQQLVILDHGLYISLPNSFRIENCQLWEYLFSFNTQGIEEIGREWGIGSTELFATLVQLKPIKISTESTNRGDSDINSLLHDFLSDEEKFPVELLFLTRTMRMIQNLNRNFGSPVNRINLLTSELINALMLENSHSVTTISSRILQYFKLFKVRCVLFVSNLAFYLVRLRQLLSGDKYGDKSIGIEDYLEVYLQNTALSLGVDWT